MNIAHVTLTFDLCLNKGPCSLLPGQPAPTGPQAVLTTSQRGIGDFQGWDLCSQNFRGKGSKLTYSTRKRSKPSLAESFCQNIKVFPGLPSLTATKAHMARATVTGCPPLESDRLAPGPALPPCPATISPSGHSLLPALGTS